MKRKFLPVAITAITAITAMILAMGCGICWSRKAEDRELMTSYCGYFEVSSIEYVRNGVKDPIVVYTVEERPLEVDRVLQYFAAFRRMPSEHEHYIGSIGAIKVHGKNGEYVLISFQGNDIREITTDENGNPYLDAEGRPLDGSIWYEGKDWREGIDGEEDITVLYDILDLFGIEYSPGHRGE